jgi:hypothetical protein
VTAEEGTLAAQNSGELAEATDELIQDESERDAQQEIVGGPGYRETEETQGGQGTQLSRNVRQAGEVEVSTDVDNEKIRSLRADVPDEIFDAATQIVKGQIINETRPAQSLTQLKNVGDVGMIETDKADFHPMMDIHDTRNQPLSMDMETEESRA